LLTLAVQAAGAGGVELLRRTGRITGLAYKSSRTDPVSDADRASEAAIVAVISRDRPGDGLFGEEGSRRPDHSGLRWVIDPLDGTVNYLYGLADVAVSIACEQRTAHGWEAVVGVVHDPGRGETFTAVRGGGAYRDGGPLSVPEPVDLPDALVATGFGYRAEARSRQAAVVAALLPRVRDIRSHGSAALELCRVAAGRCDGYYEDELGRWDWAAGALIAAEAGATVTRFGDGVLAAGPTLHRALCAALPDDPPRHQHLGAYAGGGSSMIGPLPTGPA
jgi:myo-inositol-1(or 4)-monophosphatase